MEKMKNQIIDIINKAIDCEAIVLFGSYARGTQTDESDVDIGIKTSKDITKKELYELSEKIEDEIKKDVDLVNLDTIENDGFKYEILINGEVIYCRDSYKFDFYKLDAYREYLDLNESRRMIIDELKNK